MPRGFVSQGGAGLLLTSNAENLLEDVQGNEPITSLVPDEPSKYQKYLKAGEQRFRLGNYTKAFYEFQSANYLGDNDPESLLSLSHAQFARGQYSSASYYLKRALTYFPELTVLPLRPQEFYKNPEEYRNCISALLEYLKENPQDTSALLLMIYYRWFNEEYAEAKAYLEQAEQSSPSAENIEAIETFRRGMIASGKISFEETPASQPEQSETRPDETASPAENEGPEPAEAG